MSTCIVFAMIIVEIYSETKFWLDLRKFKPQRGAKRAFSLMEVGLLFCRHYEISAIMVDQEKDFREARAVKINK